MLWTCTMYVRWLIIKCLEVRLVLKMRCSYVDLLFGVNQSLKWYATGGCIKQGSKPQAPSAVSGDMKQHCRLPHRGPGSPNPGWSWFWCIFGASKMASFCPQHTIQLSFWPRTSMICIHVRDETGVYDQIVLKSQQGWPKQQQVGLSPPSQP